MTAPAKPRPTQADRLRTLLDEVEERAHRIYGDATIQRTAYAYGLLRSGLEEMVDEADRKTAKRRLSVVPDETNRREPVASAPSPVADPEATQPFMPLWDQSSGDTAMEDTPAAAVVAASDGGIPVRPAAERVCDENIKHAIADDTATAVVRRPRPKPRHRKKKRPMSLMSFPRSRRGRLAVLIATIAFAAAAVIALAGCAPAPTVTVGPGRSTAVPKASRHVVYAVESDDKLSLITYFDGLNDQKQIHDAPSSWSLAFDNTATYPVIGLVAQTDGTRVTCTVAIDGKVVDTKTTTGRYTIVDCDAPIG